MRRSALLLPVVLAVAAFSQCDRLGLDLHKKKEKEIKALRSEVSRLSEKNKALENRLAKMQARLIEAEAKNVELRARLEKDAFHVKEIHKTLEEFKNLELKKNLLEQRIRELQDTVERQKETIRQLEEKIRRPPPPPEKPPLFRRKDCVQWYGSIYSERLKMMGIVVQVRTNRTYLVRCVKSMMPYRWAENELYELSEDVLEPCDTPLPSSS